MTQTLLNLAEFMEHNDKPLPIDIRKLGALAEKCHAYAKALHYREIELTLTRTRTRTRTLTRTRTRTRTRTQPEPEPDS